MRITTLLLAPLLAATLVAQDQPPSTLSDAEVDALAKVLVEWRDASDAAANLKLTAKKREDADQTQKKAEATFRDLLAKARTAHPDRDVLAMVDAWQRIFGKVVAAKKAAKPEGLGRILDRRKIEYSDRGRESWIEYAVYLPPAYDGKKTWPVIVALHDKKGEGAKYLSDVWFKSNDPELKALREQFIFVAPTIGERTFGKDQKEQVRIEFMDRLYEFSIAKCLNEILSTYNCDITRVYLDGVGQGAQAALQLATMRPKVFAGVAMRSAEPKEVRYLANLKGITALLFVSRKDGVFASDTGKQLRQSVEQAASVHGLAVAFKDLDPLPNKPSASQGADPVAESNGDILKFFQSRTRDANPTEIYFSTNNLARFNRTAWAFVSKGDADPGAGTEAVIQAKADRAKNVIEITTTNIETFRLYLNDALLDLDKPVKIMLNGQEVKDEKIDRMLDYLLDAQRKNSVDPATVMVAEMLIQVPADAAAPAGGEAKKDGGK